MTSVLLARWWWWFSRSMWYSINNVDSICWAGRCRLPWLSSSLQHVGYTITALQFSVTHSYITFPTYYIDLSFHQLRQTSLFHFSVLFCALSRLPRTVWAYLFAISVSGVRISFHRLIQMQKLPNYTKKYGVWYSSLRKCKKCNKVHFGCTF